MKIKILRREFHVYNLVFFLIASFFYIYTQYCLYLDYSVFKFDLFSQFCRNYWPLIALLLVCLAKTWGLKKSSIFFNCVFLFFLYSQSVLFLFFSFNKLVLVMTFFHLIIGLNFIVLAKIELAEPCYNPMYSARDFKYRPRLDIPVLLTSLDGDGAESHGRLTNWGPNSCFVSFGQSTPIRRGQLELQIDFDHNVFKHIVEVSSITKNGQGLGLYFRETPKLETKRFNWKDLYSILYDKGYIPELLS